MTAGTDARTVYDYLQTDHHRLDAIMEACRTAVAAGDFSAGRERFTEFHEGLRRHIRIEEELLFPAFDAATGLGDGGPTGVMRLEHVEIQRILEDIREMLSGPSPDAAEFESMRQAVLALLMNHNGKEERIVYPMTDRMMPPNQRLELVRKMQES